MIETLNLMSDPEMKSKLLDGMVTPLSECVSEDEIDW